MESAAAVVASFNHAINRRDLSALASLMHDDHRFVDSAGDAISGKDPCIAAWSSFFEAFPDYRNRFDAIHDLGSGRVRAVGRSECSVVELHGPASWTATVVDSLVLEWRVDEGEEPRP